MENGLYFYGPAGWQWVAEVSVALNFQGNDLTKPDSLQISYTNQFSLPYTLALSKLIDSAEQIDAGGKYPYVMIPARLIDEEETIFDGRAELQSFSTGWQVAIYDKERALIDVLKEKSLRTLNLGRWNFGWSLDEINARAGATEGVVFPVIDYGTIDAGTIQGDSILPAVYAHTLVGQMLQGSNYRPVGEWTTDPLYKAIVLPFVEDQPRSREADWVKARMARVAVADGPTVKMEYAIDTRNKVNRVQPLSVDDRPLQNWIDGAANNFNPAIYSYVADDDMRLRVTGYQEFVMKIDYGAPEVKLIVEVNGSSQGEQGYWTKSGVYNASRIITRTDRVTLDTVVQVKKGDSVRLRLKIEPKTKIARYNFELPQTPDQAFASFEPDPTVQNSDSWPVANNLPDLTCWDVLKSVALLTSGWFNIDNTRRTVELVKLSDTTDKRAVAVDWSAKVEDATEPELAFRIEPYAQKNLLTWKEQDGVDKGYGNGVVRCGAETLELETTLFELPFAASVDSPRQIEGYGSPVLIETRTITGTGENVQVQKKTTAPRLLLVEPTKVINVPTAQIDANGNRVIKTAKLTGCWFAKQVQAVKTRDNAYSLAFDPVIGQVAEMPLIIRYFLGLKRILRRPRILTVSLYLQPRDIATLNLKLPVRIRGVRAGFLDLTDGFYVVNKLSNYQSGETCTAVLIPF